MLDSTGSSKPRDSLLEKLKERIKDRDGALEVKAPHTFIYTPGAFMNACLVEIA